MIVTCFFLSYELKKKIIYIILEKLEINLTV